MGEIGRRSMVQGGVTALFGAACATCSGTTLNRDTPSSVPLANVAPWGANIFLDIENERWKRRHTFEMLSHAGVRWVYQRMAWDDIEIPSKGSFVNVHRRESTWDRYDEIVDLADEFGLRIVARIERTPAWARANGTSASAPPSNTEDFEEFLRTLATRYAGRIHHYQIWHEPNLASGWGGTPPDPQAYAALLRAAYTTLKSVSKEIIVANGQLAPTLEETPRAVNDLVYLRRLYDHAAGETTDIQAAAAFGMEHEPENPPDARVLNFRRVELIRKLMVEFGLADVPVWLSAYGWNAAPSDFDSTRLTWRRVPEREQAAWTVEAVDYGLQQWPWIGVFGIWFFRQPFELLGPNNAAYFFRMVDPDFTPRLLYRAVQQAATGRTDL